MSTRPRVKPFFDTTCVLMQRDIDLGQHVSKKHPFGVSENINKAMFWHSHEQTLHTSHTKCEFVSKCVKHTHYGVQGTKARILLQICSNEGQACQKDKNLDVDVCQLVSEGIKTCQNMLQTSGGINAACQNVSKYMIRVKTCQKQVAACRKRCACHTSVNKLW